MRLEGIICSEREERKGGRGTNSINEICIKPVHIKPGIKAKISKGLAHIVLRAKEELVSLVSVSGVP